jgi:hypothetical protein
LGDVLQQMDEQHDQPGSDFAAVAARHAFEFLGDVFEIKAFDLAAPRPPRLVLEPGDKIVFIGRRISRPRHCHSLILRTPIFRTEIQRVNFPLLPHAAQPVATEREQTAVVGHGNGKLGRDQHLMAQWLAQGLNAGGFVDRRPDHREVEAVGGADITVKDLAKMERYVNRGNGLADGAPRVIQRVDCPHRLDRSVESSPTSLVSRCIRKREYRQHPIAYELEHLAAARAQRSRHGFEDLVQHFDDCQTRHGIGDGGKTADVGVPQHGADALHRTTRHRSGMDPLSCISA